MSVLLGALCAASHESGASVQTIAGIADAGFDVTKGAATEFDLQGRWVLVRDPTAKNGVAVEHSGVSGAEDQFPLAIYEPVFAKNAEISLRLRADGGQSDRASGLAVRLSSPQDYYLVQVNAQRGVILFSRIKDGASEQIAGVDADITSNGWHTLAVRVEDNQFTVSLDGTWVFTGFDSVLSQPGNVALWAKGDGVTRFDNLTVTPLAVHEEIN